MVGFAGRERQSADDDRDTIMSRSERRRIRARVSGRVQGVFFRQSARESAASLGLSGWIRNLPDGQVELEAEGDSASVQRFIDWCRRGPKMAEVEAVEITEQAPRGEAGEFSII